MYPIKSPSNSIVLHPPGLSHCPLPSGKWQQDHIFDPLFQCKQMFRHPDAPQSIPVSRF